MERAPVGSEDQGCDGVGKVVEVICRPDHKIGLHSDIETTEAIIQSQATSAAHRSEVQSSLRTEYGRVSRPEAGEVQRLPKFGKQHTCFIDGAPVNSKAHRRPGVRQVNDGADSRT